MKKKLTQTNGCPVADNQNVLTAGPRGPMLLQDLWFLEKLAHFDREVIPERRMHAKGSGAYGTFTVTHDITQYTRAKMFSEVGKKTDVFTRFSTVQGSVEQQTLSVIFVVLPSSSILKKVTGTWLVTTRLCSSYVTH
jgi:catalase